MSLDSEFTQSTLEEMTNNCVARRSQKRVHFNCITCGSSSDALEGTRRLERRLCRDCFGKRKDTRENELNNLTGSSWASKSKSVEQYDGFRSSKQKIHGACYPLSLALQQIEIYTKEGQIVFDPFMGVGTTAEAAEKLGRKSVGIELNDQFLQLAKKDILNPSHHMLILGDARKLLDFVEPESVDFLLTSPPYGNLLKTIKGEFAYKWKEHSKLNPANNPLPYSKNKKDLGNLPYEKFIRTIRKIFKHTFVALKNDAYAVWVVKDYRDLNNDRPLVNFHSDIIKAGEDAGFALWDIRIYDQTKFRPLVVLGYPSRNYYLNIGHSYIVVFRKQVTADNAKEAN